MFATAFKEAENMLYFEKSVKSFIQRYRAKLSYEGKSLNCEEEAFLFF